MDRIDAAGGIANDNILLHARAARSVIDSLNATAAIVDDFHAPLGIESARSSIDAIPWRQALGDSQQRRTAGKEAGQKALVGVGTVAAAVGIAALTKDDSESSG